MELRIKQLAAEDREGFITEAQKAFQKGFEAYFGPCAETILPRADVLSSLDAEHAKAYVAELDGKRVGGVAVIVDPKGECNHLDLLYVLPTAQGHGVGAKLWRFVEQEHSGVKSWMTFTPYFERRNLHFYVNVCGFAVVEYICKHHPDPSIPADFIGDGQQGMLRFVKDMTKQPSAKTPA